MTEDQKVGPAANGGKNNIVPLGGQDSGANPDTGSFAPPFPESSPEHSQNQSSQYDIDAALAAGLDGGLELDDLLRLSKEKSLSARSGLASRIADLFGQGASEMSDRERALVFQIMHQLVAELENDLRKRFATLIAREQDVPREFARFLARDQIDIAWPVLRQSPVLQDADLIEVIENRALEHWLAIAGRECAMGSAVGDALVGTGEPSVMQELLNNPNAELSDLAMQHIVDHSEQYDQLRQPLLDRRDLPPDMARKMVHWVSAAMRQQITQQFGVDIVQLDDVLERVSTEAASDLLEEQRVMTAQKTVTDQLVDSIDKLEEISPQMMIRSLEDGDTSLFFGLFRSKTGLNPALARRILFEPEGFGMAVACRALQFRERQFSILFLMLARARQCEREMAIAALEKAAGLFRRIDQRDAASVMREWNRSREYTLALDQVGSV